MLSHFNRVQLFATLWAVVRQAPLSTVFSRQECCSGLPFPSPGNLPNPRTEPTSLLPLALEEGSFPPEPPLGRLNYSNYLGRSEIKLI